MKRRWSRRVLPLAAVLAVAGAMGVSPAAAARCGGNVPRGLEFHREAGRPAGHLTWRGTGPGKRYRVYRSGVVIGQTLGRSMRIRVLPGQRYVFTVRVVGPSGRAARCGGTLSRMLGFRVPSRPRDSPRARSPVTGYCSTGCARGPGMLRSPATGSCATAPPTGRCESAVCASAFHAVAPTCSASPPWTPVATSAPEQAGTAAQHPPSPRPTRDPGPGWSHGLDGRPALVPRAVRHLRGRRVPDLP